MPYSALEILRKRGRLIIYTYISNIEFIFQGSVFVLLLLGQMPFCTSHESNLMQLSLAKGFPPWLCSNTKS